MPKEPNEDYLPEDEPDDTELDFLSEEVRVQYEKDCARGVYPGEWDVAN